MIVTVCLLDMKLALVKLVGNVLIKFKYHGTIITGVGRREKEI